MTVTWNERKRRPRDGNEPELATTTTASNTRNLTATTFQPIPMTPFYYNSSLSNLPDATRDIVFKLLTRLFNVSVELSK
ncbi:hypothetical protein GQ600_16524 [Phytophthora cactorum]|nr:hypothetical protein GQ600_16524 [Phytophthora cactorum]